MELKVEGVGGNEEVIIRVFFPTWTENREG